MDKDQRLSEGQVEAEDRKLDFEESLDDEEVTLLLPRKGADERDLRGADIRDVPEASGTQQEAWVHMEPLHGARPKWNRAGRPTVVHEEPRGLEVEATNRRYGWPGRGGARSSGPTVVTASAGHAGGGSNNATEEGG